jgi:hypothetical protein
MRRTYWFLIFLIVAYVVDLVLIFINLPLAMWVWGGLFILFAALAATFDLFPKSKWTRWWCIDYKKKIVEN